MNNIQQIAIITSIMAGGVPVLSFCLAMLIVVKPSEENLPNLVLFFLSAVTILALFLVLLGGLAQVYLQWKLNLDGIRQGAVVRVQRNQQPQKEQQKAIASFSRIQVKFGQNFFLDKLTPLKCLSYSVDLTVSIVISYA